MASLHRLRSLQGMPLPQFLFPTMGSSTDLSPSGVSLLQCGSFTSHRNSGTVHHFSYETLAYEQGIVSVISDTYLCTWIDTKCKEIRNASNNLVKLKTQCGVMPFQQVGILHTMNNYNFALCRIVFIFTC